MYTHFISLLEVLLNIFLQVTKNKLVASIACFIFGLEYKKTCLFSFLSGSAQLSCPEISIAHKY